MSAFSFTKPTHKRMRTEAERMIPADITTVDQASWKFAQGVMNTLCRSIGPNPLATPREVYDRLENTSPGTYYRDMGGKATRRTEAPVALYWANQYLKMQSEDFDKMEFLFTVQGKTEILPREKYDANRCRIYMVAPLDLFCLEGMFSQKFQEGYKQLETGFGASLQNGGLVKMMAEMDQMWKMMSNDKRNYDFSQQGIWAQEFTRAVNATLDCSEEQKKIHMMLRAKHSLSYVLFCNGEVYEVEYHHASGCWVTTVFNCWCHRFQQAYVFHRIYTENRTGMILTNERLALKLDHEQPYFYDDTQLANIFLKMRMYISGDDYINGGSNNEPTRLYFDADLHKSAFSAIGITVKAGTHVVSKGSLGHAYLGFAVTDHKVFHTRPDKIIATFLYSKVKYHKELIAGAQSNAPNDPKLSAFIADVAALWKVKCPGQRWAQWIWSREQHAVRFLPRVFGRERIAQSGASDSIADTMIDKTLYMNALNRILTHTYSCVEEDDQYLLTVTSVHFLKNRKFISSEITKMTTQQKGRRGARTVRKPATARKETRMMRATPKNLVDQRVARDLAKANLAADKLSPPTFRYLQALVDPYTARSGVVSPDKIDRPVLPIKVFAKGSLSTGTAGFGFLFVDPKKVYQSDTVCWSASTSLFAGTDIQPTAAGVTTGATNSPYTQASLANLSGQTRLVSCGIRIRNTTPRLDVGGAVCGFYQGDTNMSGKNTSDLLKYPQVHMINPDPTKWIHVEYSPMEVKEFEFQAPIGTATTNFYGEMCLMIDAPASAPQTFVWELYAHVEYLGTMNGLQKGNCDPIGQAAVLELMADCDGSASDKWITSVPKLAKRAAKRVGEITGTAASLAAITAALL